MALQFSSASTVVESVQIIRGEGSGVNKATKVAANVSVNIIVYNVSGKIILVSARGGPGGIVLGVGGAMAVTYAGESGKQALYEYIDTNAE